MRSREEIKEYIYKKYIQCKDNEEYNYILDYLRKNRYRWNGSDLIVPMTKPFDTDFVIIGYFGDNDKIVRGGFGRGNLKEFPSMSFSEFKRVTRRGLII